jgi:hypothetical protein
MNYEDFKTNVTKWAIDRKFDTDGTIEGQYLKLVEEVGEIAAAMARGDRAKLIDGVGDAMVVCVVMGVVAGTERQGLKVSANAARIGGIIDTLSDLGFGIRMEFHWGIAAEILCVVSTLESFAIAQNLDPNECRAAAWGEIEHRKGEMRGGVFVREGEL